MDCIVSGVAESRTWPSDFHFHFSPLTCGSQDTHDLGEMPSEDATSFLLCGWSVNPVHHSWSPSLCRRVASPPAAFPSPSLACKWLPSLRGWRSVDAC